MSNFTILSKELIDMDISLGAFKTYTLLLSYCYGNKDSCFPSQRTLAMHMGKCTRTIRRYLKELEESNLITIKRRGSSSCTYTLLKKTEQKYIDKYKAAINKITETSKPSKDKFTNYPQREYNFDLLEKVLLGQDDTIEYADVIIV